jgi:hypothetical protein
MLQRNTNEKHERYQSKLRLKVVWGSHEAKPARIIFVSTAPDADDELLCNICC